MTDLRDLLSKATPGPWRVGQSVGHDGFNLWQGDTDADITDPAAHMDEADAALIVAAVNRLPFLLEVEKWGRLIVDTEGEGEAGHDAIGGMKHALEALSAYERGEQPVKHQRQSVNGCVVCDRKWSEHTPYERGERP